MARLVVTFLLVLAAAAPAAQARDRDRDGMNDAWERRNHVFGAKADPDKDGLTNRFEHRRGTHPRKADTDGDRLRDADELRYDWNPRKRDTDRDGVLDGDEGAGRVEASAPDSLTLKLAGGKTLTARIGEDTEMICPATDHDDAGLDSEAEEGFDDSGGNSSEALEPSLVADDDAAVEQEEAGSSEPFEDRCLAFLKPGALVHEASARGGTFDRVELVGANAKG